MSSDMSATISDGENYIDFLKRRFENIDVRGGIDSVKFEHQPYIPYDISKDIITFGDIHGDLRVLVECLKLAGCIDPKMDDLPPENPITNEETFNQDTESYTDWLRKVEWKRVNVYVVQLGDMIDRYREKEKCNCKITFIEKQHNEKCNKGVKTDYDNDDYSNTLKIYALITVLNDQAKLKGSKFIPILGNHEFMNIEYNFEHVSAGEMLIFKYLYNNYYIDSIERNKIIKENILKNIFSNIDKSSIEKYLKNVLKVESQLYDELQPLEYKPEPEKTEKNTTTSHNIKISADNEFVNVRCLGMLGRMIGYTPGQLCANWLAIQCVPFLQIGEWVFVHGGLTDFMFNYKKTNNILNFCGLIRKYLLGLINNDSDDRKIINIICTTNEHLVDNTNKMLYSVFVCRTHGNNKYDRPDINKILKYYNDNNSASRIDNYENAKFMVIAHTPQFIIEYGYGLNNKQDSNVWRCDVGMSRGFNIDNFKKDIEMINNINDDDIDNKLNNVIDIIIKLEFNTNNPLIYHSKSKFNVNKKTTNRRNPFFKNNNSENTFENINKSVSVKNKLIHIIANKIIEEFKIDRKILFTNGYSTDEKYNDLLFINRWKQIDNSIFVELATLISQNQTTVKDINIITKKIIEISINIIQKIIDALKKKYSVFLDEKTQIIERNINRYPQILHITTNNNTTNTSNNRTTKKISKSVNKTVKYYTYKIMRSKKQNVLKIDNPKIDKELLDISGENLEQYGDNIQSGTLPLAEKIKLLLINF